MAIPVQNPHRSPKRTPRYTVQLSCGCKITMRHQPYRNARFGCNSGMSHGYSLNWTQFTGTNGEVVHREAGQ